MKQSTAMNINVGKFLDLNLQRHPFVYGALSVDILPKWSVLGQDLFAYVLFSFNTLKPGKMVNSFYPIFQCGFLSKWLYFGLNVDEASL